MRAAGVVGASKLLEEHAEIEGRDRIIGRLLCGCTIVRLRLVGLTGDVIETAEVDVGVGHGGVELERLMIGVARFLRRGCIQLAAEVEPFLRCPAWLPFF